MTEFPYMLVTTTFKNGELQFPFGVILRDSPLLAQSVNEHEPLLAQDPGQEFLVEDEFDDKVLTDSIQKLFRIVDTNWRILDAWETIKLVITFKGESKWDWQMYFTELGSDNNKLNIRPSIDLIPLHLENVIQEEMFNIYFSGNMRLNGFQFNSRNLYSLI